MKEIWDQFRKSADPALRDQLINHYLPLVQRIARRVASGLPRHIEIDDLYATGATGLMRAVDQYDEQRNNRFEGYASLLIRGAMIDEVRANNWVPRSVYQKAAEVAAAQADLEREFGRHPSDEEMAARLQLTPAKYDELLERIRPAILLPLHTSSGGEEGELLWSERIADERSVTGADLLARADRRALLEKKLRALPKQERKVLYLYYYEELMLREIGELLGVSESRVSQIHTKALLHLRSELEPFQEELRAD